MSKETEKGTVMQEAFEIQEPSESIQSNGMEEKAIKTTASSSFEQEGEKSHENPSQTNDYDDEEVPILHAKTYLAVFTVAFIYFTQLLLLVGGGLVSDTFALNLLRNLTPRVLT
jgi:hypothetical protein